MRTWMSVGGSVLPNRGKNEWSPQNSKVDWASQIPTDSKSAFKYFKTGRNLAAKQTGNLPSHKHPSKRKSFFIFSVLVSISSINTGVPGKVRLSWNARWESYSHWNKVLLALQWISKQSGESEANQNHRRDCCRPTLHFGLSSLQKFI